MDFHNLFYIVLISNVWLNAAEEEPEKNPEVDLGEQFKGLKAEVLVAPPEKCERYSLRGDILMIHYKAWRARDMWLFESSYEYDDEPEAFPLGSLEKIPALDLALVDMCVGEKRKLIIPADYGFSIYGSRDGKVGPDEDLIFEVELFEIRDGNPQGPVKSFYEIDADGDGYLTMEEMGQNLWKYVKMYPKEHSLYKKDPEKFRDVIWSQAARYDSNHDGFMSWREYFYRASLDVQEQPSPDYYLTD